MLHFFTAVVIPRRVRFGVFISVRVGVRVCVRASALRMHIYTCENCRVPTRPLDRAAPLSRISSTAPQQSNSLSWHLRLSLYGSPPSGHTWNLRAFLRQRGVTRPETPLPLLLRICVSLLRLLNTFLLTSSCPRSAAPLRSHGAPAKWETNFIYYGLFFFNIISSNHGMLRGFKSHMMLLLGPN